MEMLTKYAKFYVIAAMSFLYVFILYKLFQLNWFETVSIPTLIFYGFFIFMFPLVIISVVFKKKTTQKE